MPKKTKKAKLIAQYRRKLQQLEHVPIQPSAPTVRESFPTKYSTYTIPKELSKQVIPTQTISLPTNEFLGIQKDLLKTLLVISLFFGIEVALWKIFG